jgi:dihydrofolate reductase
MKENTDMGRIVISETVSLDGIIQDPTGEEGFRFAGWFDRLTVDDRQAWAKAGYEESLAAEALLMGRRTYEWFVARGWPAREGAWPERLRTLPKHVVSSTLRSPEWANSTVLTGDVTDSLAKLRHEVDGDIVLYGSGQLARTLIEHDLFDELRLMVCPFALGEGETVLGRPTDIKSLRLTETRQVSDSIVYLAYQPAP